MRVQRGLILASIALMGLLLGLHSAVGPAGASQQSLAAFLPGSGQVAGWTIQANSEQYAPSSDKLHVIYDGGDGEYITAGVTEALKRTYKRDKAYLTVTIHKMGTDWQKAKAFYTKKKAAIEEQEGYTTVTVKNAGCYGPLAGMTLGYSWTGYYMVTYLATDKGAGGDVKQFIEKVAGKMAQ
jgi:hypothetical protein